MRHGEHAQSHSGSACGVAGQGATGERGWHYADDSNRAAAGGGFAGVRPAASTAGESPVQPEFDGVEV